MTIRELMYGDDLREVLFGGGNLLKCELIALDAKDGKILFDTMRNNDRFIEKYLNGNVSSIWADVRCIDRAFGSYFKPVMKCYVTHDSWKPEETGNE